MDVKESSINDHNQQSKDVLDSDDEDTLPWSTHQMDSVPLKTKSNTKPLASKNIFLQKENKKHDPRLWDDSVSTDCARRPVKTISLEESYQLQQKDQERTQARELRDTAERLSRTTKMPIGVPKGDLTNYRDRNEEKHVLDSDGEDEEDSNQPGGLVASNENDDDDDDYLHL
ncbi:unnamed protein product [Meganyctiphanes norvegica]|uniref:Uncharacterized protein n=1 Tax=Meganyctiphanes norvegica TaxID=48144 RepID=A0AAV2S3W7_MEGNR